MNDQDTSTIVLFSNVEIYTTQPEEGRNINKLIGDNTKTNGKNTPLYQQDRDIIPELVSNSKQDTSNYPNDTTLINQEYLGDSLADCVAVHRLSCVLSGMGTGKTTAIEPLLSEYKKVFYCCPNKKLAFSMAGDLQLTYYEDYKRATSASDRADMGHRIVGTPQMLALLLKHDSALEFDLVVFDESESASGLIVSDACKNKSEVIRAINTTVSRAKRTVFMDADLGYKTEALMESIHATGAHTLRNNHKRWQNITAQILHGDSFKTRKQKVIAKIEQDLIQGLRPAITTSSKQFARKLEGIIKKLFPSKRVMLIDSESNSPEVARLVGNTDLIVNYDVLIYTPAIGSGVSFDVKNHIDKVYGIFTNNKRTGGTQDAMQALARVRHPKQNSWFIVFDDDSIIYKAQKDVKVPDDISKIASDNIQQACFFGGVKSEVNTDLLQLYSKLEFHKIKDKNNFQNNLLMAFDREQITIAYQESENIADSVKAEEASALVVEEEAQRLIDVKTKSPKIDETQASTIKTRLKFRPDEVTQIERDSLERFRFEAKYNICCDEVEDIDTYLDLDKSRAIEKCVAREIAQADNVFNKRYVRALVAGLGEVKAFQVDIADKKIAYNLKRKLYAHVLKYSDGSAYTHKSLKRSALAQWIDKNRKALALYEVADIDAGWKHKPALVVNRLLENMGFSHETNWDKKEKESVFTAYSDEPINELLGERAGSGNTWVERTSKLMDLFDTADNAIIAVGLARLSGVSGLDLDIRNHIENCLFKLPASMHESALDEYLTIAKSPRAPAPALAPLAQANIHILELTEKYGLKRVEARGRSHAA